LTVRFTKAAKSDLMQIGDWIARENPHRAVTFIDELEQACRQVGEFPLSYPEMGLYQEDLVRRKVFKSYLIFYRVVQNQDAEILRVLHGAMDFSGLF
jgi:toxin ParE1/3/4